MGTTEDTFQVRLKQPMSIDVLLELDLGTLANEIGRLEDSIERLIRSNEEMVEFEDECGSDLEARETFKEARAENLVTIETQKERIEMIKWCIRRKTRRNGADNTHYHVNHPDSTVKTGSTVPPVHILVNGDSSLTVANQSTGLDADNGISL
ncbi:hypothetical protein PGT21_036700 [Puccinia graminis f. sp. tritici]|uniref:Uncharacterized protein n=2 Tax=Puccinia graminis f. sp. tritici TaxID=56615 RepID=E3JQ17_PUCGT|nr:uncharacterized protein PGTG_00056 [Puccinia graminis f. sp. tritici CRL 75-36-700-3]EFP74100.1 hypothetical protein PGTG_00056 [Puccinia graminis f. sp. tritici CRL 75-36-700-3]KAA1115461.1 hypothetical protein PGT21_036700 [Puccinia graminis f. sp. tritici]KAA1121930.1 hypothetical protein PGTUg99_035690 [Puccinia graminis f. sp. tritici]